MALTKREAKNITSFKDGPGKGPSPEQEKFSLISRPEAQQIVN